MTIQHFLDTLCLWHRELDPVPEDEDSRCSECSSDLDTQYCDSCDGEFLTEASCGICEKLEEMWAELWAEYAEEMGHEIGEAFEAGQVLAPNPKTPA
ncbi:MAG: hypothetical protein AB7P69_03760 [Candidatus Binatia bacterium]